ncbi:MAG: box helicase domain protein [Verrucomicrobiales bacterium]|nr:box helicase domain protein [Verrucomicrobiales bacterium]
MSSQAFSLLHRGVQEAIFKRGWKELHAIQAETIPWIIEGHGHLLISAHTAGGKTEAAFLPIISTLANNPRSSVQALYIGPLVALINDQFERLETLCSDVDVPVHRWHGSASATEKRKLRDSPGGILLITPESLESNFINYGKHLRRIYADLKFIVIDELHSFLSSVRGVHLRSLIARLVAATGCNPRLVGLSATLGDPNHARSFLAPDAPETVKLITGKGDLTLQFGIKAYLHNESKDLGYLPRWHIGDLYNTLEGLTTFQAKEKYPLHSVLQNDPDDSQSVTTDELDDIASHILHRCKDHTNLIFGNAKQSLEVLADRLHAAVKSSGSLQDPFHVHHGSLSKEVREETEAILKSGKPATVLCSSTLEMGIDIGSVWRVMQLDAPWTVASLRQRMGRSGRREGQTARMCVYSRDDSPHKKSSLTDLLFPKLLRAIALAELMFSRWLEPHDGDRFHLSTLVHQILSCLRETGGMSSEALFSILINRGAFRKVSKRMFLGVLSSLGECHFIEQIPTGELILAPEGESVTANRDFYAAFASSEEFIVRHDENEIGKLQSSLVPPIGEDIILGGRRWRVIDVHSTCKTVFVSVSEGGKAPLFRGPGGEIHNRVVDEMHIILSSDSEIPYLDGAAQTLLKSARAMARQSGVLSAGFIVRDNSIQWFPWLGTRGFLTLELQARCSGIATESDILSITYRNTNFQQWQEHLSLIGCGERTALELAKHMKIKTFEKFDETIREELLDETNSRDRLDLASASSIARKTLFHAKSISHS